MKVEKKQVAAMAIAAIAEELGEDVSNVRVVSFRELENSSLEDYLTGNHIIYRKYQLGDEMR